VTQNLCESLNSSTDQRVHTEQRVQTDQRVETEQRIQAEENLSAPSELAQQTAVETDTTAQVNAANVAVDLSALDLASSSAATRDQPVEVSTTVIPAKPQGFASFGFSPELLDALTAIGYEEPSPIQKAAIPELLLGRDLVGQAQTGTGKTAAFALPMLAALDDHQRTPQVLVLTPTRELAIQVADAFKSYAVNMPHLRVLPLYGGSDFRDQIVRLKRGVQIVVGTPGRVMDHMRQGTLDLTGLRSLVLDEADEMLRMGFIDDVEWVLEQLPSQRQVVLFSATMPPEIRRISHKYLNDPAEVTIKTKGADSSRIRQRFITVNGPQKLEALTRVLESETKEGVIIFARTKAITVTVAEALEAKGYDVAVLNGDVAQSQRERTIERLKSGTVDVLVATDVAARGLDVDRITLVVNYDIPFDSEAYVHRVGRTGRAGRSGDAILFVTPRERRFLGGLERAVGRPIEPMPIPSNATINQSRLDRLRQRLCDSLATQGRDEERALLSEIVQRVGQESGATPEQLALAALQLVVGNQPLLVQGDESWIRQAGGRDERREGGRDGLRDPRRQERPGPGGRRGPREQSGPPESGMERFRIEVGWRDRVKPGNIVGAIANEAGLNGRSIGRIQIFDAHSLVDLPQGMPDDVFQGLRRLKVMNRELQISRSRD
jgi:ATP-dependent RNA helicase DeaD